MDKENPTEDQFFNRMMEAFQKNEIFKGYLAHIMLVGPPDSGKSSLMARLLHKKRAESLTSIAIVENAVDVEVELGTEKSTSYIVEATADEWVGNNLDEFVFTQIQKHTPLHEHSTKFSQLTDSAASKPADSTELDCLTITNLRSKYQNFQQFNEPRKEGFSLHLRETESRLEFQEMLPLLHFGPSIFFFVFRIDLPLDQTFKIEYRIKGIVQENYTYESSITIEEALLKFLATIDARRADMSEREFKSQQVFIIATHTDELREKLKEQENGPSLSEKVNDINTYLGRLLEAHKFLPLVIQRDSWHIMFEVNNYSSDEVAFNVIRSRVCALLRRDYYQFQYRINYLFFCFDLQRDPNKKIVEITEFRQRAKKYGIEGDEELEKLLYFLNRIGMIQHFDIGSKHIVVLQPQYLFQKVNDLVTAYNSEKLLGNEREDFKRGIMSLDCAKGVLCNDGEETDLASDLLEILVKLRITAKFQDGKYFFPCVLNRIPKISLEPLDSKVQPLFICFERKYCPNGLFPVLITYLVSYQNSPLPGTTLEFQQYVVSKDQLLITVKSDECTFHKLSLRVIKGRDVEIVFKADDCETTEINNACITIRKELIKYLNKSIKDLRYNSVEHKLYLNHDCEGYSELLEVQLPKYEVFLCILIF